jgi:glucose-1-phosphate adenylyltransferase
LAAHRGRADRPRDAPQNRLAAVTRKRQHGARVARYHRSPMSISEPHPLNFDQNQVLVMVLAGGEGKRLYPLTLDRAKPAVPFAGRYRIIDIVLSNFVNSGLNKIKVLTQYKSASLEEHIARNWRLAPILDQFIEAIPAQQRTGKTWYRGSADAVWQCQHVILDEQPELVCIFGGDHVYKMDVRQMISFHKDVAADATVAAIPVPREEAGEFGVIEVGDGGRIVAFHEKVDNPPPMPGDPTRCLASMGNYVFQKDVLLRELQEDENLEDSRHDFGHDILPRLVKKGAGIHAYDFATNVVPGEEGHNRGYWRDIGTIDAYWQAQMDLIEIHPQFNLYNFRWPLRTGATHDPPAKFVFRDEAQARVGIATDSMVSHGSIISGGRIHRSVLGVGCRVNSFSEVEESVLFERVRVGRHAKIRRAIIDKDVEIPSGTVIGFDRDADRQRFHVTESGTVVIPKRAKL